MTEAPEPKDKLDAATAPAVVVSGPEDDALRWRQVDWRRAEGTYGDCGSGSSRQGLLEPCAGKLARTVLRGLRRGNGPELPANSAGTVPSSPWGYKQEQPELESRQRPLLPARGSHANALAPIPAPTPRQVWAP